MKIKDIKLSIDYHYIKPLSWILFPSDIAVIQFFWQSIVYESSTPSGSMQSFPLTPEDMMLNSPVEQKKVSKI